MALSAELPILAPQVAREVRRVAAARGSEAGQRLFVANRDRCQRYLEHGDQLSPTRLCFNSHRHDPLSSVREHDNIAGLEVRRRVLEEAEVVPGRVVEAVDRHVHGVSTGRRRCETPGCTESRLSSDLSLNRGESAGIASFAACSRLLL